MIRCAHQIHLHMYTSAYINRVSVPRSATRETSGRVTAARECSEETLHVIGDSSYFVSALENYIENNVFKVCH